MNLASRGLRDMGDGPEPIEDEDAVQTLQARSRGILVKSFLLAVALGGAVYFWPSPGDGAA